MCEHIYEACYEHYRAEGPAQRKFKTLKGKLRTGQLTAVVNCLRQFNAPQTVNYLLKNEARLDYPRFKAEGLPKSSARIESACKSVIGTRFKQGGMRWSLSVLKSMLALRCAFSNDRLKSYYEGVATTETTFVGIAGTATRHGSLKSLRHKAPTKFVVHPI